MAFHLTASGRAAVWVEEREGEGKGGEGRGDFLTADGEGMFGLLQRSLYPSPDNGDADSQHMHSQTHTQIDTHTQSFAYVHFAYIHVLYSIINNFV